MGTAQSTDNRESYQDIKRLQEVKFYLHEQEHTVKSENVNPNTSLNTYLRNVLHMTGTKGMCYEGGCGSCIVVLQSKDPVTNKDISLAVNSCLIPLLSCNGWRISTIEGIGNPVQGYHPIQEVLAKFNGTQCGFCSPGFVMNMYALYESGKLTMEQVENSFNGNICRCTGYRPILSAFKSLCTDASPEILGECPDIEDFVMCPQKKCVECPKISKEPFFLEFSDSKWVKVHNMRDLLRILNISTKTTYRLVAGNTAQGVFPSYKEPADLYIDISDVSELKQNKFQNGCYILGTSTTLTNTIEYFNEVANSNPAFGYLKSMANHIDLVANIPVRNRGTIAGNLIMKHDHNEFPSDIFLILETVGAKLTIVNLLGQETQLTPKDFVYGKYDRVVLKSVTLFPYPPNVKYISYKIMPRAQNTHAHVNAGFLYKFNNSNSIESATVVYGNINSSFVHATQTENFLLGKNLFDNSVLNEAYTVLGSELNPAVITPDPSPKYRKGLAISLFYKGVLSIAPSDKISERNKSGGELLKRPVSNGTQDYETKKSMYPVTEPIRKLEALAQTSGQAQYIMDMPDVPFQLYGALVLAKTPPNSTVKKIDPSKALASSDVVAFYGKDDIPGDNIYSTITPPLIFSEEELFCTGKVKFYEQPLGILVGKTQEAVDKAVDLVEVTYDPPNMAPLLSTRQILEQGRTERITEYKTITASRKGTDVKHVVKGTFDIYHQYHFYLETLCCNIIPNENGLEVYSATQWMDMVQLCIARVLKIPQNKVHVTVRRCGGAFGGKITRATIPACAAALAAWKLKKPVKIWLPLTTNMAAIGKRYPFSTDYEVGVNDKGVIQYLNCSHYSDVGFNFMENVSTFLEQIFLNTYTSDIFTLKLNRAVTDTPGNTWTRAPGSVEGLASLESIMEHVSYAIGVDPLDVRSANLSDQSPLVKYISDIKSWANIAQRKTEIETFNKKNRWKKKGLAVVPMSFDFITVGPHMVTVSIFHLDGSVQIAHGGIEIGQGINTKAAQVCAYKLGISIDKITVLPSNSFTAANAIVTGASIASDGVCYATIQACDTLLERIKPHRTPNATWEEVIAKSHENYVELVATGIYSPAQKDVKPYQVYGICASEVLVDILTGQHLVTRVDLIEDTGDSLNPVIDIGQVEGAFIMGLGYYTTEKIVFNYEGKNLTRNTWTYLPPQAKDIPVNFNVKFPKGNPNPVGVLKSKGTGEPAICLAISIPFAIRNALASARRDATPSSTHWYPIDGTTDLENVFLNSLNNPSQYTL